MTRLLVRTAATVLCCLSPTLLPAAEPAQTQVSPELDIQIVFDNTSARDDLRRSWGFSAPIDFRGHRVLFDAGSDPILMLEHLELMQIDPKPIEHAIISHEHGDHLRGVYWVFEKNPDLQVHFMDCFPEEAFRRAKGVKLVKTAQAQRQKDSIRYLLGGFHLLRKDAQDIKATINQLQDLNVQAVSPAHCSGDLATEMFQTLYGPQFHAAGVGRRTVIDNGRLTVTTLSAKEQASSK